MAHPLPNEAQVYQEIKDKEITIPDFIWDAIYNFLGDYVSVINLVASYYVTANKPISMSDGRRIVEQTRKIMDVVRQVIYPHNITDAQGYFVKIKEENIYLPGIIRECFMHYIGNDTYLINLCIYSHIDYNIEQDIPVEDARRILEASSSIRRFLDRLRQATRP